MLRLTIPSRGELALSYLLLDVNGTLTLEGVLLPGVADRLRELRDDLEILLVSADTYGALDALTEQLGVRSQRITAGAEAAQKAALVAHLGPAQVVAVGNGANDAEMLRDAALGIAIMGEEGLASACMLAADVVIPSITAALDLLLRPKRLLATLRF
jgi:P-type E1-E2 ATPase